MKLETWIHQDKLYIGGFSKGMEKWEREPPGEIPKILGGPPATTSHLIHRTFPRRASLMK